MSAARLKTEFWVQACVRRGDLDGTPVMVVRKGDPTSGAILIKRNRFALGCTVLVETRDAAGERAWYPGTGPDPVDEAAADAYIERSRSRDPDLWVIEIEDRHGRLPFDEKLLDR
jgi:GMP synthase (glutamine-hydrolysing)